METDLKIRNQLRQGVDLTDAYFHIPLHPQSHKYMRVHFRGRSLQFRAICFGFCTAPCTFTNLLHLVAAFLRSRGVVLHRYLDDWMIRAPTDCPRYESGPSHSQPLGVAHNCFEVRSDSNPCFWAWTSTCGRVVASNPRQISQISPVDCHSPGSQTYDRAKLSVLSRPLGQHGAPRSAGPLIYAPPTILSCDVQAPSPERPGATL